MVFVDDLLKSPDTVLPNLFKVVVANRFAEQVRERLCNYSAQDLKKHDLLRVTTAADAANIVAEMDGVLRGRETATEAAALPTADDIFTRMSAYMGAPAAA